jgi:sulfur carrier protein ThiS
MHIRVKCFATLAGHTPADPDRFEIADASSVADLVSALGIPPEAVKIVFLDGIAAGPDAALGEGCRVGIFPAVGGG